MRLPWLLIVCLLVTAAGCRGVEFVDDGPGAEANQHRVDEYEPDGGGAQMTAMSLKRIYLHTLWPDGDVDFSYLDTSSAPGTYTVLYSADKGQPVALQVWIRPSPTRGPSQLVYERTLFEAQWHGTLVRTTAANPCIAIRAETAINGYAFYELQVQKGDHLPD